MNNPYAKLGGGALDQELFKKKSQQQNSLERTSEEQHHEKKEASLSSPTGKGQGENTGKKLLGARIYRNQYEKFIKLYRKLNPIETRIDKADIIGLGIEALSLFLESNNEEFTSPEELKSYLVNNITNTKT